MITANYVQFDRPEDKERMEAHQAAQYNRDDALHKWITLIDSGPPESQVQEFMERYPDLVPGLKDKHNGPRANVIASKFPFGSDFVSDFAFLTVNSMECQFTFVEIEAPAKPIFNKDYSFTSDFNRALQQVRDWHAWAMKNMEGLVNMYADLLKGYDITHDIKTAKCYLVYGRRKEVESPIMAKERWTGLGQSLAKQIEIMTFDRLTANIALQRVPDVPNTYALCSYKQRGFYWKSISEPT